jgi:hypothetical protein
MRVGEPSDLFEDTWTVMRWVEGELAGYAALERAVTTRNTPTLV